MHISRLLIINLDQEQNDQTQISDQISSKKFSKHRLRVFKFHLFLSLREWYFAIKSIWTKKKKNPDPPPPTPPRSSNEVGSNPECSTWHQSGSDPDSGVAITVKVKLLCVNFIATASGSGFRRFKSMQINADSESRIRNTARIGTVQWTVVHISTVATVHCIVQQQTATLCYCKGSEQQRLTSGTSSYLV